MKNFADRLIERIQQKQNPTVVGLDPVLEKIPDILKSKRRSNSFLTASNVIREFCFRTIDAIHDVVPCIKIQQAFFERFEYEGLKAMFDVIERAYSYDLIVILDAKKNDIGSTSQAYSDGALGQVQSFDTSSPGLDVDALTINPYLGTDGMQPFIDDCNKYGKGIFVLVKTSNPSSSEIQDLDLKDGRKVYQAVGDLVSNWGENLKGESGYSSVGAVVGATHPDHAADLRKRLPHTFFLVPGFGAQGASASDIVNNFDQNGQGAIVNSSRGIIYAYKENGQFSEDQFDQASREAAFKMKDEINYALNSRL